MNDSSQTRFIPSGSSPAASFTIRMEGELADSGRMPADELGACLQGWSRLLQIMHYADQASLLELPPSDTSHRIELLVQRIDRGSFEVSVLVYFGLRAVEGIIGGRADALAVRLFRVCRRFITAHISAKRQSGTLDAAVAGAEAVAKDENIRVRNNREATEDFVSAFNSALANATTPLDSSAAVQRLSVKGQDVEIVIDAQGRQAIRAPFAPPTLDPEAEAVIEQTVKFVRINRKTGNGLFTFVNPSDESQVGTQRFHCESKAIRRRANRYTLAFHQDVPLKVKLQRKAYEQARRGHYWLIVGESDTSSEEKGLFNS